MRTGNDYRYRLFGYEGGWWRRMFLRPVSIEIGGGLGNQLFSLVAGVFISRQIGVPLRVFVNDALSSTNHQGQGLTSFKFF